MEQQYLLISLKGIVDEIEIELDKILREFAKIPHGCLYDQYLTKKIDGETFKAWHRIFPLDDLASLFNMSAPILTFVRKNYPEYNKDDDSAPIKKLADNQINPKHQEISSQPIPSKKATGIIFPKPQRNNHLLDLLLAMEESATKRLEKKNNFNNLSFFTQNQLNSVQPNLQLRNDPNIEPLNEIENPIISSSAPEQQKPVITTEPTNIISTQPLRQDDNFLNQENIDEWFDKISNLSSDALSPKAVNPFDRLISLNKKGAQSPFFY